MPEPDFDMLQKRLLDSGVAPRHVIRFVSELSDHYEDLEAEAVSNGLTREAARTQASERIGDTNVIAEEFKKQPELQCWARRFPQLARVVLPAAYILMLPAAPLFAGVAHAPIVGRWFLCLILSGVVTSSMILVMQIAIAIS